MSGAPQEFVEIFLQEASEHLQFLREYSGILQDPYPVPEDVQRLYISAHTLEGSSGLYGFPFFREVTNRLGHIFQYAMNASIAPDAAGPLVEFILEAIAVLESDLLVVSTTGSENVEEMEEFKQRFSFAFQPVPDVAVDEVLVGCEANAPDAHADSLPAGSAVAGAPQSQEVIDLDPDDDIPAEILEFFIPETEEHLQVVQECLLSLETHATAEDVNRLFRAIHTIKGSAAQVGLRRIAKVAHRAEDLIGKLRDGELQPSAEITDICLEAADALRRFLYSQWDSEVHLQGSIRSLFNRISCFVPEEVIAPDAESGVVKAHAFTVADDVSDPSAVGFGSSLVPLRSTASNPVTPDSATQSSSTGSREEAEPEFIAGLRSKEPTTVPQSKSVRIALERLDSMMNAVGELVINRTRMLGRLTELERLAEVLNYSKARMSDKIDGFQEKYEFGLLTASTSAASRTRVLAPHFERANEYAADVHSEFSELEMDRYDDFNILSRSLTEISADITEVLTQLDGFVRRIDQDIDEFSKLAHRLQDEITQARMVPIGNLYTRISRTLRDAAKAAGKQAELTLTGAETELDNNIIQQISDPLIHLVRNAVAHGLENPEGRYHSGKPDQGTVAVRAYHRGNHIFIEVQDDGSGIDFEEVRKKAVETGIVPADAAAGMAESELLDLLFHPGFSTADGKTELAGRGVGLDVVKANVAALNGEIEIDTKRGVGTRFTLKVPLTLIISQALFVRCGNATFALPLASVEEIRSLPIDQIEDVGGKLLTRVRDVVTEVVRLDQQLGLPVMSPANGAYRMVIVNVAGRQVGLVVEDVLRKDEIVIKNLGEYLRGVKLFPGTTIAPDGSLILLIDVNRLAAGESIQRSALAKSTAAARIFAPGAAAVAAGSIPTAAIEPIAKEIVVVLVDDSISVRRFVGSMLEKAGYRVRLAADGLEALEIATQTHCDLILSDLEMPRANGYELMRHLRQDPNTREVPVVIVTSRAGAKHRDRALKEGAAAFMTKPVQEEQLIEMVRKLAGAPCAMPARAAVYA